MTPLTSHHAKWIAPQDVANHVLSIALEKWPASSARGRVHIDVFQWDGDNIEPAENAEAVCTFTGNLERDPENPRGARIRDVELTETRASAESSSQLTYISFDPKGDDTFAVPLNPVENGVSPVSSLSFRIRPGQTLEGADDDGPPENPGGDGPPSPEAPPEAPPEEVTADAPVVRKTNHVRLDIETMTQGNGKWKNVILRARDSELPNFVNTGCSVTVATMIVKYLQDPNPPDEDDKEKKKSIFETRIIPALIDDKGAPLDAAKTSRPWEFLKSESTFRPVLGKKVEDQEEGDTEDLTDSLKEHAPIGMLWYARTKDGIDEGDYMVKNDKGEVVPAHKDQGLTPKAWRKKIVKDNKDNKSYIHRKGYVNLDGKEDMRVSLGLKKTAIAVDGEGKWATKVKEALDKGLPVWSLFSKGASRRLHNCHTSANKRKEQKKNLLAKKKKDGGGTDLVAEDFRGSGHYVLFVGYRLGKNESIEFELADTGDSRLVRYIAAMTGDLGPHPTFKDSVPANEKKRTTKGTGAKYLVNGLPVEVRFNRSLKSLAVLEPTDWKKEMGKFLSEDKPKFKEAKATDFSNEKLEDTPDPQK